jgi:hypothetical protein
MLPELTLEEVASGLDGLIEEILAGCGCNGPPVDAMKIARAMGITIALDDGQEGRARYVRLHNRNNSRPRATILVHSDPRLERLQWAVAHEIGEHVAYKAFHRLGVDPVEVSPIAREQVANQLAGRLLIPSIWFHLDAAAWGWDLPALKRRYSTASHELIARRMLECRPAIIITIVDQGRITFRRSNLPGRAPPPSAAELTCWRLVHEKNRPQEKAVGLHNINCWPVHEPDWKREILRLEIAEYEEYA